MGDVLYGGTRALEQSTAEAGDAEIFQCEIEVEEGGIVGWLGGGQKKMKPHAAWLTPGGR